MWRLFYQPSKMITPKTIIMVLIILILLLSSLSIRDYEERWTPTPDSSPPPCGVNTVRPCL